MPLCVSGKAEMLNTSTKELFCHQGDVNSFTLKFQMLNNTVKNVSRLKQLAYLDIFLYKQCNCTIKEFCRLTLMRKGAAIEETVCVMNSTATAPVQIAARTFGS